MKGELSPEIGQLVEDARVNGDRVVDLAPIATRLFESCRRVRKAGLVNGDIKPENIMVACGEGPVDQRLRLIDFGLAQRIQKEGDGPYGAGTPAFMALSAFTTSASSREDVESAVYVVSELVLRTQAVIRGEKVKAADDTYLSWDVLASDATIAEKKREAVTDSGSEFYKAMPANAASSIKQCFKLNWNCGFDEEPEYAELTAMLSNLHVPLYE
jgi:serine/threonine protein kinase